MPVSINLQFARIEGDAVVWNADITTSDGFTFRHGRGYRLTAADRERPDDPESPLSAAALALAAGDAENALRLDMARVAQELEARAAVQIAAAQPLELGVFAAGGSYSLEELRGE